MNFIYLENYKMKLRLILLFLTICAFGRAQVEFDYGVKGSISFNDHGDLHISGGFAGLNETIKATPKTGFQLGFYTHLYFDDFYLQPEFLYTKSLSEYKNAELTAENFSTVSLDFPVLVGYKIDPVRIFTGPVIKYILDTDFADDIVFDLDNEIVLGYLVGAGVQIRQFGLDVRYASEFTKNLAIYDDNIAADGFYYDINAQNRQIIISLSVRID